MKNLLLGLLLIFILTNSSKVNATQYTWTGNTDSIWNTTTNWSPSGAPGSNDTVTIVSGRYQPMLRANATVKKLSITSGILRLDIYTLTVSSIAKLSNGEINGATAGNLVLSGDSAIFSGTLMNVKVSAICSGILLNGSVFNYPTYLEMIGGSPCYSKGGNTFNSKVTFKMTGSGTYILSDIDDNTFQDSTSFISTAGEGIVLSVKGKTKFNGHVNVSSTHGDILLGTEGSDSTLLASGKHLTIGASGFSSGTLLIRNFYQIGSTTQSLTLTSSAVLNCINSQFNAVIYFTAPAVLLSTCTFNDSLFVVNNANYACLSAGGNIFNSYSEFINDGNSDMVLAHYAGDVFKGTVSFKNNHDGALTFAYSNDNKFYKDLLTPSNSRVVAGYGTIHLMGDAIQNIKGVPISCIKLIIDKTDGYIQLDSSMNITDSLIFINGIIHTSASHLITLNYGCKTIGASNSSFVDGPVKKIGNTAFVFPVGNINFYRPLEISSPSNGNDAFTAQYFHNGQQFGDSISDSLFYISSCNYWNLDRNIGSSVVTVKLSWDTVGCSLFDTLNLRIVQWDNTSWRNKGKNSFSGDVLHGSLTNGISLSTFGKFTLGNIDPISPLPIIVEANFNPDQGNVRWNHDLQPDFMGYNGASVILEDQEWYDLNHDTKLDPLLTNNAVTTIRYPGGTTSNYWDWRTGWFIPEKHLPNDWVYLNQPFENDDWGLTSSLAISKNKLEYFTPNANLAAANPIFVWNTLTSDFHYQLASLYSAKEQRLPVKYIELGNEFYLNTEHNKAKFTDAAAYRKTTDDWCQKLKAISPFEFVKIALTGASSHDATDPGRKRLWLDQLLVDIGSSYADAITLHEYYSSGLPQGKFSASKIPQMLKQPFLKGDELLVNELSKIEGAGLETWITEYNMNDDSHNNVGTWAHGLFVAAMTLKYLESPSITKVISHTMNSNAIFGDIYASVDAYSSMNNGQIPAGNYPLNVNKWEFSATGSALNEIAIASRNCSSVKRIDFGSTVLNLAGSSYPELYGWAFYELNGSCQVIILNMGQRYYSTNISNLFPSNHDLSFHQIYSQDPTSGINGNPNNSTTSIFDLRDQNLSALPTSDPLLLHPFSISRIKYTNPSSVPVIEFLDNTLCVGEQSSVRVSGGFPPYTIDMSSFDPTQSQITSTNTAFPFSALTSGTYTLSILDNLGNHSNTITLDIYDGPSAIVSSASTQNICRGDQVDLTSSFTAGDGPSANNSLDYSYIWTPSEQIIHDGSNPDGSPLMQDISVTPQYTTTYQVFVTDGVCWSHGEPIEVLVKGSTVDAGKDIILCASTAELTATYIKPIGSGGNAPTYAWSSGATSASFTTPTLSPGNNSFTVTVTDDGCTTSDVVDVFNEDCCNLGTFVISPAVTNNYIRTDNYIYTNAPSNGFNIASVIPNKIFTVPPANSINTMEINGELDILDNHIVTLQNCTIHLGENAMIKVTAGATLILDNCTISSCFQVQKMWQGIKVDKEDGFDDPSIEIYSSTISDANQAIYLARDANYKIDGNTFDNNYEDIVMEKYQGSNHKNIPSAAFTDNYIRGNTFTSSSTTLLNGKYKLTAIDLNDVEFVVIGQNPSGLGNDFDHSSYGIKSTNSGFNSIKNTFNLIKIYGNSKFSQASIFATENNTFSDHTITIGKNGVNTFLESTNGIVTNGPVNLDIKQNNFGTSTSATDRITGNCIKIENTQNKDIVVSNSNNFFDYNIGVYLHNVNMFNPQMLHNGTFAIMDNVFITADISSGANFKGTAIAVHNDFNYFIMNEGEISGNQIGNSNANRQPRIGISVSEINNINIHHNEIYFHLGTNPSLYYKGIWMQNSYNALLWNNKIENTVKLNSGALFTGLESDNCLIPAFYCNRTYKISYGMYFHNDDEFARLQKNEIKQYEIGIQLDNANIGNVQGDDVTQTGYGNEWDDSETSENRVDGQTMSLNPIDWYFHNSSGYLNIESALPANNLVVKPFPNSNDISWDCQTDVPTHITSSVQRNKVLGDVIGDSASYTTGHETEQSYLRKTSTYGILSANPSLLNINDENDESFQSWFTTKTSSNIGKIANVDRLISFGDFIGAQSTINTIESTNDQEENYKVVYGIYLHHHLSDSAYSSTDSSTLYTVAILNPLIGGNAVYAARNILFLEIEDAPLGSNERKANYQPIINTIDLKVYPVPANENISLLSNDDLSNYLYEIKDISGRLILKGKFTHEIDLLGIESGIYFIQLIKDNSASFQTKFTVIKK